MSSSLASVPLVLMLGTTFVLTHGLRMPLRTNVVPLTGRTGTAVHLWVPFTGGTARCTRGVHWASPQPSAHRSRCIQMVATKKRAGGGKAKKRKGTKREREERERAAAKREACKHQSERRARTAQISKLNGALAEATSVAISLASLANSTATEGALKEYVASLEGEPPLALLLAAVACAGSGSVLAIPVQQLREINALTVLDLSRRSIGAFEAQLLSLLLPRCKLVSLECAAPRKRCTFVHA